MFRFTSNSVIYAKRIVPGLNRFYRDHFQNTPNIKIFFGYAMSNKKVSEAFPAWLETCGKVISVRVAQILLKNHRWYPIIPRKYLQKHSFSSGNITVPIENLLVLRSWSPMRCWVSSTNFMVLFLIEDGPTCIVFGLFLIKLWPEAFPVWLKTCGKIISVRVAQIILKNHRWYPIIPRKYLQMADFDRT